MGQRKFPEVRFSDHAPGEQPLSDARPLLLPLPDHQHRLALPEQPGQVAAEQPLGHAVQGATTGMPLSFLVFLNELPSKSKEDHQGVDEDKYITIAGIKRKARAGSNIGDSDARREKSLDSGENASAAADDDGRASIGGDD